MSGIVQKINFPIGNTRVEIVMQHGFAIRGASRDVSLHRHPNVEVHYVEKGDLLFSCPEKTERLSSGTLVIVPARLYHSFSGTGTVSRRLSFEISIKPKSSGSDTFSEYKKLLSSLEAPLIHFGTIPEMLSLSDLMGIIEGEEELCRINAVFTLAFLRICDILRVSQQKTPSRFPRRTALVSGGDEDVTVISILNYIQSNFHSPIKLSDVANAVNLSERQVQRILSSKMNEGFHSLLTQHRITAFKSMLASPNEHRSLETLAYECGFTNYVSFWKQFKKLTGQTPEQFRAHTDQHKKC